MLTNCRRMKTKRTMTTRKFDQRFEFFRHPLPSFGHLNSMWGMATL
jgi:hypothetical protein